MGQHTALSTTLRCTALLFVLVLLRNANGEKQHELNAEISTTAEVSSNIPNAINAKNINNNQDIDMAGLKHLVKRAPSNGFMAMRGKKENDELGNTNYVPIDIDPMTHDYNDIDINDSDGDNDFYTNGKRFKKAPTAFYGVRGKKLPNNGDLSHLGQLIKQLEEEHWRDSILQDFIDRLALNTMKSNEIVAKRAPTGFTGMRGKRPLRADLENDNSIGGGIVGLNGGNSAANGVISFDDELAQAERMDEMSKRAPVNAFMGVRGKKDVSHQEYKRSIPEAFDARGKKQRFVDFGNKFVAVRGKKYYDEMALEQDADLKDYMARGQLLNDAHYFVNYPVSYGYKRAPSGFTGVRGKRPVAETNNNNNKLAYSQQ